MMGTTTEDQRTINAAVSAMQEAGDRAGVEMTRDDLEMLLRVALPGLRVQFEAERRQRIRREAAERGPSLVESEIERLARENLAMRRTLEAGPQAVAEVADLRSEVTRLRGVLDGLRTRLEDAAAEENVANDPRWNNGREWGLTMAQRFLAELYPPTGLGVSVVGLPTGRLGGSLASPDGS